METRPKSQFFDRSPVFILYLSIKISKHENEIENL